MILQMKALVPRRCKREHRLKGEGAGMSRPARVSRFPKIRNTFEPKSTFLNQKWFCKLISRNGSKVPSCPFEPFRRFERRLRRGGVRRRVPPPCALQERREASERAAKDILIDSSARAVSESCETTPTAAREQARLLGVPTQMEELRELVAIGRRGNRWIASGGASDTPAERSPSSPRGAISRSRGQRDSPSDRCAGGSAGGVGAEGGELHGHPAVGADRCAPVAREAVHGRSLQHIRRPLQGRGDGGARKRGTGLGGITVRTLLLCLIALAGVVDRCHATGYWIQANPPELVIGHPQNLTVTASGLPVGASDYVCSFRTDIVNPLRGEFEARTSPLRVISPTLALCEAPAWDLPAVSSTLEILKSDSLVPKDGAPVTVAFLPIISGLHPARGPASGGLPLTLSGRGFDPEHGAVYTASFEGIGGRVASSPPCLALPGYPRPLTLTPPKTSILNNKP